MRRVERAVLTAFVLAPWGWLLCLAAFAAAVALTQGRFPSYSNPDPKHAGLDWFYLATVLLLLPTFLSPIVFGAILAFRAIVKRALGLRGWLAPTYVAGIAGAAWVVFGGAFGLIDWLLD